VRSDCKYSDSIERRDAVNKARMLLERGASVFLTGYLDFPPLGHVGSVEMATLLFEYGAGTGIDQINLWGETAIARSICNGDTKLAEFFLQHGADMSIGQRLHSHIHAAIRSKGNGSMFDDDEMNIEMLQFVLENAADLDSRDYKGLSVLEQTHNAQQRYATRLIELIIAELPTEMERWTPKNVDAIYQSLIMSMHSRGGAKSGMCILTPEMLQLVIQKVKSFDSTNMVANAMSSIKRRNNGRFPIKDSD
jgi:hypothetical protein